jgi:UDP-2,3-diacylglucosamine pyrophosphatase LpxH
MNQAVSDIDPHIVIISDLHLGVDDRYAETVDNRELLVHFIEQLSVMSSLEELIIAGDLFDEWFLPATFPFHTNSDDFYLAVAQNNKSVIDALAQLMIQDIKVTYIPGNHDMLLGADVLSRILPGISQARDARGLGTYRTGSNREIVVEHGHRYNIFCAPDAFSNKGITGAYPSILPPGYFFTRIASTWVSEGKPQLEMDIEDIPSPDPDDVDATNAYLYYQVWRRTIERFSVHEPLDEKFIDVDIDGFKGLYALDDVLPVVDASGRINAFLFKDFQKFWDMRQTANEVAVPISFTDAMTKAASERSVDEQAMNQYFDIDTKTDIVVFGHTHVPKIQEFVCNGKRKVYANSGTWIDENLLGPTATFVAITPATVKDDAEISLFSYNQDGTYSQIG